MYIKHDTHIDLDGTWIPIVEDCPAYQRFLDWCAIPGNVPQKPPGPTLEQRRAALKDAATAKRWQCETGGITLTGIRVLTGKSDQDRIASVIVNAQTSGIQSVDFKADSGWVTLSIEQITEVASAVARHVQACFTAERGHHAAIDTLTAADLDTYDVTTGWPG
ncbi:DUF4376 domain-containing protein [Variovorax sp. PAMC26660]|uniref:DUF4376 domain-containing protein n=1 Tax=Variovorax sp. PAMC26660 TaxID=2762322 RepID=UPI00164E1C20|nr:DUF4376 domain-containing protein [Variovorax sp. PAMC26660]QNK70246.1 DUF4376 domain-containing protein [Variovorax sp. PAMC26660]